MIPSHASDPSQKIKELQKQNQLLEQRLAERQHELEVYRAVQLAINRQLDPQGVLQMIAEQARQMTHCAASAVYLIENDASDEKMLRLAVVSGELNSQMPAGYRMPLNQTVAGLAIREQKPFCVQDALHDPRVFASAVQRTNMRSFLIVPLLSGGQPIGVISVANKMDEPFHAEDERILMLLASSVVISLENARLYAQAGELAVLNERNRLARELHDAVTQSLFSASLIGDVLPSIWQQDPAEGQRRLEELRQLTRGALAEMRTLLLELRPSALENAPLPDLFRHLSNAFIGRTQIPLELNFEGNPEYFAQIPIPVKTGIYRIAQEALNNVMKHAEAQHVWLTVQATPNGARVEIVDDGKGFVTGPQAGGHLGLEMMQERANLLGGMLEVQSQAGKGTTVVFTWLAEDVDDE